jgi:hypothetical protein
MFFVLPRLWLVMSILIAMEGCAISHRAQSLSGPSDIQRDAESIIAYLTPDEVNLSGLERSELAQEKSVIFKILEQADAFARLGIGYRTDKRRTPLTRADFHAPPADLSCTEFVWLVYSLAGLNLGNFHIETKEMAYDKGVYAPILVKLKPTTEIRPGDILVYEYPDAELMQEIEYEGRYHAGHAVIVVSAERKIVVGSHGAESTPSGAPLGVGYRRLLHEWNAWTAGRTLKAVYRLSQDQEIGSDETSPRFFTRPLSAHAVQQRSQR